MKNLNQKRLPTQTKVLAGIVITIILICGLLYAVKLINGWFDKNYFVFTAPVEVKLNQPISVKERKPIVRKIILDYGANLNDPLEKYICEKFGIYDCQVALAIASAESGMREEVFNINTNGTIDVGLFQINSIHFKQEGCSLKEISDAYKNVDCAYSIWKVSGWNPWVAFINGNFASKL